jgi:hypothetical protein
MLSALSLIVVVGAILAHAKAPKSAAPAIQPKTPGAEYAGSAACAQGHQDIYKQFSKTGMGHLRSHRDFSPVYRS